MAKHERPDGCWSEYRWIWGPPTPHALDAAATPFWIFANKALYHLHLGWLWRVRRCPAADHDC